MTSVRSRLSRRTRTILIIWAGWAALMLAFQALALARFDLVRPDRALDWTAAETGVGRLKGHPYLQSPVLAGHAAWDSEYYVSIALEGYDDPAMPAASPASTAGAPVAGAKRDHPTWVSLSHAFFPGYPAAMALIARPAAVLGAPSVAAGVVAGVAVSLVGALGAMLAIADLAGADGTRAAFYLAIWPGSAFLAQVYSEGLFLGLSFGALALMRRDRMGWAAALAVAAVFTRPTGVLLEIPFAWAWLARGARRNPPAIALALAPALAWLAWRITLGGDFDYVESRYFGRGVLALGDSWDSWTTMAGALLNGPAQAGAAAWMELIAVIVALGASAVAWRRDRSLTLYGLVLLALAATSGAAVGMQRYVLSLPALFLGSARLGRSAAFDRLWTLGSCLGLAMLAIAFSSGFWAG